MSPGPQQGPPRIPLSTYTPPPGCRAHTLTEAVEAMDAARQALLDAIEVLRGCMTPLNLESTASRLAAHARGVDELRRDTEKAQSIIEQDRRIAPDPFGKPWASQNPARALTPQEILEARSRANVTRGVTYRQVAETQQMLPTLVDDRDLHQERTKAARAAADEKREEWITEGIERSDKILADLESRPCAYCGAQAGECCLTTGGTISGPHKDRRALSPLAEQYPSEVAQVRRVPAGTQYGYGVLARPAADLGADTAVVPTGDPPAQGGSA